MIQKSKAVVLKTVEFKETSLIATLFTQKHGKIAVIAKGARRPKNKFAAFLVPGQMLEVLYYYKQSRSVQTLSEVSYIKQLSELRYDIDKMALSTITMELVSQLIHDNEVNEPVFEFLIRFLPWLNERKDVSRKIFPYVQIRLAQLIGIGLQAQIQASDQVQSGFINIQTGELSDESSGSESIKLNSAQFKFVNQALHSASTSIFSLKLNNRELAELIEYLDKYFRYHIEGIRPRRSDKIFDQLIK